MFNKDIKLVTGAIFIATSVSLIVAIYTIWLPIKISDYNKYYDHIKIAYSGTDVTEVDYPQCQNTTNQCNIICEDNGQYFYAQCLYCSEKNNSNTVTYCSGMTCPAKIYCVVDSDGQTECSTDPSPIRISYLFLNNDLIPQNIYSYAYCSDCCGQCLINNTLYNSICVYDNITYCPTTYTCPSTIYVKNGVMIDSKPNFFTAAIIIAIILPAIYNIIVWPFIPYLLDIGKLDHSVECFSFYTLLLLIGSLTAGLISVVVGAAIGGNSLLTLDIIFLALPSLIPHGFYFFTVMDGAVHKNWIIIAMNVVGVLFCFGIGFPLIFTQAKNNWFAFPFGIYCIAVGGCIELILIFAGYFTMCFSTY